MENRRAYAYIRVSTTMQVEGNSLEGQMKEIEAYCLSEHIDIIKRYSDEGKSGKTIAGRPAFQQMLNDIEKGADQIDTVVVWKLSRFARNTRESLDALHFLEKHGVDLIAKVDHIDTRGQYGKFMFTMLAALAEMERENIIEQTNNGKKYNAISGRWNGGAAPYGYELVDRELQINPEEAKIVQHIYDIFLREDIRGYSSVTAILNEEGLVPTRPKLRKNRIESSKCDETVYLDPVDGWYNNMVKKILDNPVYCGKIRYGYYTTEKNEDGKISRRISETPELYDGIHEAIISPEIWEKVQAKRMKTGIKKGRPDKISESVHNIYNRIAKCPQCGNNMVHSTSKYITKNGIEKLYEQYICGYYNSYKKSSKCRKNAIRAEILDDAVTKGIVTYMQRPSVLEEIKQYINSQKSTEGLEKELEKHQKECDELNNKISKQYEILTKIGSGKYRRINEDKILEAIENYEELVESEELEMERVRAQIEAVNEQRLTYEVVEVLMKNFSDAYCNATKEMKKRLIKSLIKEIKLGYNEKGKVIPKSMTLVFNEEQIVLASEDSDNFGLNKTTVECVVLMSKVQK